MRVIHRSLIETILGASLWGLSGNAAQVLFQEYRFPVNGLVAARMLASGLVLLLIIRPSAPPRPWARLLALAVVGYAGAQFFYLIAIQYSDAPTATLLQFLFLPIVACYEAMTGWFRWSDRWTLTIILALVGTFFLVVGESLKVLITPLGFAAGLLAAFSGAYYTLGSKEYVRKYGSWWITSYGFTIGGLIAAPFSVSSLWNYRFPATATDPLQLWFLLLFVILFGTLFAFGLYVSGLKHLTATETGVASSVEPIVSALAAYVFLGVVLTPSQYFGGALIVLAVILVAIRAKRTIDNHRQ
jgi:drug/metabolite transporter (DMT)-like permease